MKDIVVTGRKYRVLKDKKTKIWKVISWWTHAEDVEFADGRNLQDVFGGVRGVSNENINSAVNIPTSGVVYKLFQTLNNSIDTLKSQIQSAASSSTDKLSVRHIFKSGSTTNIEREELLKPLDFASSTMNKVGSKAYFGDGAGKGKEGLFCIKGFNTADPDAKTGVGFLTTKTKGSGASANFRELGSITYDGESFYFTHKIDSPTITDISEKIATINKSLESIEKEYKQQVTDAVSEFNDNGITRIKALEDYKEKVVEKLGTGNQDSNGGSVGLSITALTEKVDKFKETYDNYTTNTHAATHNTLEEMITNLKARITSLEDQCKGYERDIAILQSSSSSSSLTKSDVTKMLKSYATTKYVDDAVEEAKNAHQEIKSWAVETFKTR